KEILQNVRGVEDVGVFRIKGQPSLEFPVDDEACGRFGVSPADVHNVVQTAIGARPGTQLVEGEKLFDLSLRFKKERGQDEDASVKIAVDVTNNIVTPGYVPSLGATTHTGGSYGISTSGTALPMPAQVGSVSGATYNPLNAVPRRQLGDLVYRRD